MHLRIFTKGIGVPFVVSMDYFRTLEGADFLFAKTYQIKSKLINWWVNR